MSALDKSLVPRSSGSHHHQLTRSTEVNRLHSRSPQDHNDIKNVEESKASKSVGRSLRAAFLGVAVMGAHFPAVALVDGLESSKYIPSPVNPGWQVYVGAAFGVIPFMIATYEFTKRVIIQRRCKVCNGSGLVRKGKYYKKCVACGGFLPWLGWRMFFFSSPGNGTPVMPPIDQKGKLFYSVPKEEVDDQQKEE